MTACPEVGFSAFLNLKMCPGHYMTNVFYTKKTLTKKTRKFCKTKMLNIWNNIPIQHISILFLNRQITFQYFGSNAPHRAERFWKPPLHSLRTLCGYFPWPIFHTFIQQQATICYFKSQWNDDDLNRVCMLFHVIQMVMPYVHEPCMHEPCVHVSAHESEVNLCRINSFLHIKWYQQKQGL